MSDSLNSKETRKATTFVGYFAEEKVPKASVTSNGGTLHVQFYSHTRLRTRTREYARHMITISSWHHVQFCNFSVA